MTRQTPRAERALKYFILLGVSGLFVLLVAGGFLYILSGGDLVDFARDSLLRFQLVSRQEDLEQPFGSDTTPQRIEVEPGDTALIIARKLLADDVIDDIDLFVDYVRLEDIDRQLEVGTYFVNQTQTIPQIAVLLTDARNAAIQFVLPEGSRIEEVAQLIDSNPRFTFSGDTFLRLVARNASVDSSFGERMGIPAGASLEGFLWPDRYFLPPTIDAAGLRDTLLQAFDDSITDSMWTKLRQDGLSMYQAVTFASIVERETFWGDESAKIAGVYRNRYDIGMKLDADPTVQYALDGQRAGSWWPGITQADYNTVISPYNTYINTGLPPGPIASPGPDALQGSIFPLDTDYFYFQARCDGSHYHTFAFTYAEHLANSCF